MTQFRWVAKGLQAWLLMLSALRCYISKSAFVGLQKTCLWVYRASTWIPVSQPWRAWCAGATRCRVTQTLIKDRKSEPWIAPAECEADAAVIGLSGINRSVVKRSLRQIYVILNFTFGLFEVCGNWEWWEGSLGVRRRRCEVADAVWGCSMLYS